MTKDRLKEGQEEAYISCFWENMGRKEGRVSNAIPHQLAGSVKRKARQKVYEEEIKITERR